MFNSWMLGHDTCLLLVDRLRELRPDKVLEVGSGFSTVILALYSRELIALEHDEKYAAPWPPVRVCPLKNGWYQTDIFDDIDFVLIDGPPVAIGRSQTLPNIWPYLAKDFEIWLDDFNRTHEKAIVKEWQTRYPITVERIETEKGLAIIRPK